MCFDNIYIHKIPDHIHRPQSSWGRPTSVWMCACQINEHHSLHFFLVLFLISLFAYCSLDWFRLDCLLPLGWLDLFVQFGLTSFLWTDKLTERHGNIHSETSGIKPVNFANSFGSKTLKIWHWSWDPSLFCFCVSFPCGKHTKSQLVKWNRVSWKLTDWL